MAITLKKYVRPALKRDIIDKRVTELARSMVDEAIDSPDVAAALICKLQTLLMSSRFKVVR